MAIAPDEFKQYQEGFGIFQAMIDAATDPQEKAFLNSSLVFSTVTGLDPEASYEGDQIRVLYQALQKTGALNKFALTKYENNSNISFIHLEAAKRVLVENRNLLGIKPLTHSSNREILNTIYALYGDNNLVKRHIARGLLSGFPSDAVQHWVRNSDYLNDFRIKPIDEADKAYLKSKLPVSIKQSFLNLVSTSPFLVYEETPPPSDGSIGVSVLGVDFIAQFPPSPMLMDYCQKMLEIDRRLGVTDYIYKMRATNNIPNKTSYDTTSS